MISQETNFKRREAPTSGIKPDLGAKRKFASNLLYLRNRCGLTITATAEDLGVEKTRYATWEKAESAPNYDYLVMIARYHNVSIDALLTTYMIDNA